MATLVVGPFYLSRALGHAAMVGLVCRSVRCCPAGRLCRRSCATVGTPRITMSAWSALAVGFAVCRRAARSGLRLVGRCDHDRRYALVQAPTTPRDGDISRSARSRVRPAQPASIWVSTGALHGAGFALARRRRRPDVATRGCPPLAGTFAVAAVRCLARAIAVRHSALSAACPVR